mmetsp:Transcript_13629/g.48108  ORF Transcript_13629/g.48108 Transcript_13629/m.48108 type:complete len:242 (+) Transcript_13629:365-1090(+)
MCRQQPRAASQLKAQLGSGLVRTHVGSGREHRPPKIGRLFLGCRHLAPRAVELLRGIRANGRWGRDLPFDHAGRGAQTRDVDRHGLQAASGLPQGSCNNGLALDRAQCACRVGEHTTGCEQLQAALQDGQLHAVMCGDRLRRPLREQAEGLPNGAVATARHVAEHPVEAQGAGPNTLSLVKQPRVQARKRAAIGTSDEQRGSGGSPCALDNHVQPDLFVVVGYEQATGCGFGGDAVRHALM